MDLLYKCDICLKEFKSKKGLSIHILSHNTTNKPLYYKCNICDMNHIFSAKFSTHLKNKHNISTQEYYDKYLKNENEDICPECGNKTKFLKISQGYSKYCSFECYKNSDNVKQLRSETNLKRYGVENCFQTEKVLNIIKLRDNTWYDNRREKIKETNLERYGVENVFSSEKIKEKIKQTNLRRYGVEYNIQSSDIYSKSKKRYLYENTPFDSSWELAYYIHHKDMNYNISRNINGLIYFSNNKKHIYFPDFILNNEYIEIKGNNLISKDKLHFIDPVKHIETQLLKDKMNCLINNNVKILCYDDIKEDLEYIKNKYGKNFLKQFKNIGKNND